MGLIGKGVPETPPNTPPEWSGTPAPSFVFSTSANYDLSQFVTDADNDTLIFVLSSASPALPTGVSLSSAGVLTAGTAFAASATSAILVEVNDGVNAAVTSPPFNVTGNAVADLGYPRLAVIINGGFPTADHTLAELDEWSNANVGVFNFTDSDQFPRNVPGVDFDKNDQQMLDYFRSNNPNIGLLLWATAVHTEEDPSGYPSADPYASYGSYVKSVIADLKTNIGPGGTDWYAYKADGSPAGGDWPNQKYLNWSSHVTADANGDKLAGFQARRRYDDNAAKADWDGFLVDVQETEPGTGADAIDFDQDGATDESVVGTTGTGVTLYKTYQADFVTQMVTRWVADTAKTSAEVIRMGNNGNSWTSKPIDGRPSASPSPEYIGMNTGSLYEGAMGRSYSPDQWGAGNVSLWKSWIVKYWIELCDFDSQYTGGYLSIPSGAASGFAYPLVFFNGNFPATNYQRMRYQLCTSLMGDGYFNGQVLPTPSSSAHWNVWQTYDEYHNGTANTYNWMGQPVDGMVDASVKAADWNWPGNTTGVYAREFDNAAVFVNPDGNGSKSIDPTTFKGGSWKKINGTQDPAHNDGSNVTGSITLNDGDGIILVRQ